MWIKFLYEGLKFYNFTRGVKREFFCIRRSLKCHIWVKGSGKCLLLYMGRLVNMSFGIKGSWKCHFLYQESCKCHFMALFTTAYIRPLHTKQSVNMYEQVTPNWIVSYFHALVANGNTCRKRPKNWQNRKRKVTLSIGLI